MKSEQGMTLVEVLVTVIILAMLASVATLSINFYIKEGKTRTVDGDLAILKAAVRLYILDKGSAPASLNALVTGYIPELPKDPFNKPPNDDYLVETDADNIYIYSVGPNGTGSNHNSDDNIYVTINKP